MLDSGKLRKTKIGPSPPRSRGRFAHEPFSQPMPQPQGYKEELEQANGAIDSIKKALFHGSSHCLSLHAWAEELGDVQRAMRRETRDLQPGAHVLICALAGGICRSLPACLRRRIFAELLPCSTLRQALADPTWHV